MNPSTAFADTLVDELIRCGLSDAVIAPGSRSAPLAMALWQRANGGPPPAAGPPGHHRWPRLRLHVRIDERSAGFLALGLAKAGRRPVVVVCTSGTAAAHLHGAVIEAGEAGVPLLVLTADRPPELRGTGANQTIDQLKLYGGAVRWFCETGVPEARPGMNAYWRSLACRAWAAAAGLAGGSPGPVHLNVPLREPLVPGIPDPASPAGAGWPEPLAGRPGGSPWTAFGGFGGADDAVAGADDAAEAIDGGAPEPRPRSAPARPRSLARWRESIVTGVPTIMGEAVELPWTERGVVVCGDGCGNPVAVLQLAEEAGWPVLAEPSSGARSGPNALSAYPYLLESPEFVAAHLPDLIVSAGRPGLSRGQLAYLKAAPPGGKPPRHVVLAQGPGRWADPARTATDVVPAIRLVGAEGRPGGTGRVPGAAWLASWRAADAAARAAADAILDAERAISEPRLARDLAAALPDGGLLWAASSLPIRDLDRHMAARAGVRVLASRGASGIDGLVSSAIGAALAHQAGGGGPAAALLGDLAFLHDAPGLFLSDAEPRPDLVIMVVNNDGGGIFSTLEQAAYSDLFDRVFGTPHGAELDRLAAAAGLPVTVLADPAGLPAAMAGQGIRVVEVRTGRAAGAALRERVRVACATAAARSGHASPG